MQVLKGFVCGVFLLLLSRQAIGLKECHCAFHSSSAVFAEESKIPKAMH